MNEDRLVTLILWIVLLLAAASLVAVYYTTSEHRDVEPLSSSANLTKAELSDTSAKESPPSPVPASRDAITLLANQSTKEHSPTALPPRAPQVTINETSNPNGAFYIAQDITEGVIIGKRGTASDRADYYKVRATGHNMILRLEPSLKEKTHRFIVTVFDTDKRSIGEDLEETGHTITLTVTPQATYYIKLDLSHAPIETHQYQLHVHFNSEDIMGQVRE